MIRGTIEYGNWKDGSSIYKDNKGYYIFQYDISKDIEYKKYLKNFKPTSSGDNLYLDKSKKKWTTKTKTKTSKAIKTKRLNRPSPPYPANDYCGKNKKGNDGYMYKSTKNKLGICRWKKI